MVDALASDCALLVGTAVEVTPGLPVPVALALLFSPLELIITALNMPALLVAVV